jgi:hypothetical protein
VDAVTYAKRSLEQSFKLFNVIADGMTDDQYNWKPEGTANSIAKTHVHAMTSVEFFITATLQGREMEWASFAKAQGLPANPTEIWGHTGRIALAPMKDYGATVQAAAIAYVEFLSASDLDREVDTSFFGKKDVAFIIGLTNTHVMGHGGDMAAIKGLQGLKGLPF